MANRLFNGRQFSENGWPYVDQGSCTWVTVPGTQVHLQIQSGEPAKVMGAFAADFNAYIEKLDDPDSASWTPGNSVATSNHPGGTAMDLNWEKHPFQQVNTFNSSQQQTLNELLAWYEDTIFWGGRWQSPKDEMHFQMGYDSYQNPHTQDFINRKIRTDGFSTFRRDELPPPPPVPTSGLTVQNLADVMGNRAGVDYASLLRGYRAACGLIGAQGNLNRLAMFAAQLGHESGGLQYMEEIASGAAYEGRSDLGNTQQGDGVRFKGRGPIQITGRGNYLRLSQWAAGKGLVPTPTYFVDNPTELAKPDYGFLGAIWYWTVARPNINSQCDAGDIVGVTKAINGGTNGLADRNQRWNHALSMGLAALDITGGDSTPQQGDDDLSAKAEQQIQVIYEELTKKFSSRSVLRRLGEGPLDTMAGFILNADGSEHLEVMELLAGYGHPPTLALLREVAGADPVAYPDRQDDKLIAQAILHRVTSTPVSTATAVVAAAPAAIAVQQPQIQYVPVPTPMPAAPVGGGSTGQIIGQAYDSLEALLSSGVLSDAEKSPLLALIGVLQTKTEGTAS